MRKLSILLLGLPLILLAFVLSDSFVGMGNESKLMDSSAVVVDSAAIKARFENLTEADYKAVADSLGIEVPLIKAVVLIEAGPGLKGFWKPGVPIINFDLSMFQKVARQRKINLQPYRTSHPVVFAAPRVRQYGSRQAAQYARLDAAMSIDTVSALEGTFWGMFQIGGFNWASCSCSSVGEFVHRMSLSEREQLDLFAAFITHRGLVKYLKAHNWAAFSLRYNGPLYKQRGYDTKLLRAYTRFVREMESGDTIRSRPGKQVTPIR